MNRKILTKKYKRKSSRKSRKIKNKNRKRKLRGGATPPGLGSSSLRAKGSRASSRPSSRASDRYSSGISKHPIPSICCQQTSVVNQEKIISSINNFPQEFGSFYSWLLEVPDDKLPEVIENFKLKYSKAITIPPQGAYLNINGLKFINYLRSKFVNSINEIEKYKIERFISLLYQYGAAPGVRNSDLKVIKKKLGSHYFECYKNLYEDIYRKLFKCDNSYCYPVSTSAISLYCRPKHSKALKTIDEE